jgi:hypothetical protein
MPRHWYTTAFHGVSEMVEGEQEEYKEEDLSYPE